MKFNKKIGADNYFAYIKNQADFPEKYFDELFLISKLTKCKDIKRESTRLLKEITTINITASLKNRSKFSDKMDTKSKEKNLILLLKLGNLSPELNIGRLYTLLEDDTSVYIDDDLNLDEIPESIGQLDGIKELWFNLRSPDMLIPPTIKNINSLELLRVEGYGMSTLPKEISQLKNLRELTIELHRLTVFPEWVQDCPSLESLEFGGFTSYKRIEYERMPDLTSLTTLKKLEISSMKIDELPQNFLKIANLESFGLGNVEGLKKLPASIKYMKNLNELRIGNCPQLEELPEEIKELENLETLKIGDLPALKKVKGCIIFKESIKNLFFSNCDPEIDMTGLENAETKKLCIRDKGILKQLCNHGERFKKLEILEILECKGLESIPDTISKLETLKHLRIEQYSIKTLPETIGKLKTLETLKIRGELEVIPDTLSQLQKVKDLWIESSELSFSCTSLPPNVEALTLNVKHICLKMNEPMVSKTISIKAEEATESGYLNSFECVEELKLIGDVNIPFKDIAQMTTLKKLYFSKYKEPITSEIRGMKNLENIEIWHEKDTKEREISPMLGELPKLIKFKINYWSGETALQILLALKAIEEITLYDVDALTIEETFNKCVCSLKEKVTLKRLEIGRLNMSNNSLQHITSLTQLESLYIQSESLKELPKTFLEMKNLKSLSFNFMSELRHMPEWIGEIQSLENLELENMYLETLPASLANLPHLRRLSIYGTRPESVPDTLNNLKLKELKIWFSRGGAISKKVLNVLMTKDTKLVGK